MEEIKEIETQLPLILEESEQSWTRYRDLKKEYDEKTCKLKTLYILYTENRKKEEKERYEKEQKDITKTKHIYKKIVKVFNKKKKRGRPKNIFVIDRCGIEILKDPYLTLQKLKNYAKINKIKRYTKMNREELIKSLLSI